MKPPADLLGTTVDTSEDTSSGEPGVRTSTASLSGEVGEDTDAYPPAEGTRLRDLGPLGAGGMAEVRRVLDPTLRRTVAMKIVHEEYKDRPRMLARFMLEAQVTAQLQHPGVVPVHELGRMPDGRLWFTMREIRGRTLTAVIREVHAADLVGFRRLVDTFARVCETVAFAHDHGVVHRDLKPDNVMVGDRGEVSVLDWGLAKIVGRADLPLDEVDLQIELAETARTKAGTIAGTPHYMAPEQARGEVDALDRRTDVYSLGAVLYEILHGLAPRANMDGATVVGLLKVDTEVHIEPTRPVPHELIEACRRAMRADPDARYADAGELLAEISAFLDGANRRERAIELVERASALAPEAERLRERARELQGRARADLDAVPTWEHESQKSAAWAMQDDAVDLDRRAGLVELEAQRAIHAALEIAPDLPEAHAVLALEARADHEAREAARDATGAARAEARVVRHSGLLPEHHPVRIRCARWLDGTGALTLLTDPPGASVELWRYRTIGRRLEPVWLKSLGNTPLIEIPIKPGSYVAVISHRGRVPVRYPIHIAREAHWDGVPPGARASLPIRLLRESELADGEIYVPAGWFVAGGDPGAVNSLPQKRLWCDPFAIRRVPVTNAEMVAFLDALVVSGRADEALEFAPRHEGALAGVDGQLVYGRAPDGRFLMVPDAQGDVWEADWPALMVDWHGAMAYSRWLAARTGLPWRLPGELEREKAARGVDGRLHPWGDFYDGSWCCQRPAHRGRPLPARVGSYPVDVSPYGVADLAGNCHDWCAEVYQPGGPEIDGGRVVVRFDADAPVDAPRVRRGGYWNGSDRMARSAYRGSYSGRQRHTSVGFRLARSV